MLTVAIIILASVLIGAFFQRITGMGVGLLGGPVMSIFGAGRHDGQWTFHY